MNARFSGKLVIVAGAPVDWDAPLSLAFLEEGAKVVFVTFRNQNNFDALRSPPEPIARRSKGAASM